MESEKDVLRDEADQECCKVNPLVIAKICLNVGLIRSQLGDHDEAIFMHEKSLKYKSSVISQLTDEIRDAHILLAF